MHSPFITREGARRVDTCCSHSCNQGRSCVIRQACEMPEDDFPSSNVNWRAIGKGALALVAFGVICASPFIARWGT